MKRLIGFIGLFWVVICSHASDYTLLPIATQSQLPVAELHNLIQDSEGYMWYATGDGGLCRDNGYHIDVFRSDKHHPTLIGKSNLPASLTKPSALVLPHKTLAMKQTVYPLLSHLTKANIPSHWKRCKPPRHCRQCSCSTMTKPTTSPVLPAGRPTPSKEAEPSPTVSIWASPM